MSGPYKAEEKDVGGPGGKQWIVAGPGFEGRTGVIRSLFHQPHELRFLTEIEAHGLADVCNDVWLTARRQKEREVRGALGLTDWGGEVKVGR